MEIMKLVPVGKERLWGGRRLKKEFGKTFDIDCLGESWECSVHPDGECMIANGSFEGQTLSRVLKIKPEYIGTKFSGCFPILAKFIDANRQLSVQVHPGDEYARINEHDNGKTEMWYVLDADTDACLIYGFAHPVNEDILRKAVLDKTLDKHLQKIPVRKGDVYYIPAGTVHGIGAGILLAEIQQSSNVTYRVYDYDRQDKDGNKRELHLEKAIKVLNMDVSQDASQGIRLINYYPGCSRQIVCRCKYFDVEKVEASIGFDFSVLETSFQLLMCFDGSGEVWIDNDFGEHWKNDNHTDIMPFSANCYDNSFHINFSKGDTLFIPASAGRCHLRGKCQLLKVRC